jgi:hypothetical protein
MFKSNSGLQWFLTILIVFLLGPIAWLILGIVWYTQAKTEVEHNGQT